MTLTVRYRRGEWPTVVGPDAVLVLTGPSADEAPVEELAELLRAGAAAREVVASLLGAGMDLRGCPDFVLLGAGAGGVHVAVRGPVAAEVDAEGGRVRVDGADAIVCREEVFPAGTSVRVGAEPGGVPIVAGVVYASALTFDTGRTPDAAVGAGSAPAAPPAAAVAEGASDAEGAGDAEAASGAPVPEGTSTVTAMFVETPQFDPPPVHEDGRTVGGGIDYAALMGAPVAGPAQSPQPDGAVPQAPQTDGAVPEAPERRAPDAGEETPDDASPGRGAPGGRTPAAPGPPAPQFSWPAAGDHDGNTSAVPVIAAPPGSPPDSAPGSGDGAESGDPVVSRVCAMGHPNPPQAGVCRGCGEPLTGDPAGVDRPVLGTVRVSTGVVFELDRSLLLGRRPRADNQDSAAAPRLITLPSPDQAISRTHARIDVDGWSVVAVDLDSTNGTYLRRGQAEDRRLMAHVPQLLADGDVLVLGDITVRFEGLP